MTWYEILMLLSIPTIIFAVGQFIIVRYVVKRAALNLGVQALLRDRLLDKHDIYTKRGYCSEMEKSNYNNMYKSYHNLGQNGVMDTYEDEVISLPTTPPKKKPSNKKWVDKIENKD